MGVNIVQSFCVILHEIHTKCSLELVLSILILGEAPNANLPSKIYLLKQLWILMWIYVIWTVSVVDSVNGKDKWQEQAWNMIT